MDAKFFLIFIGIAIVFELVYCIKVLRPRVKQYRKNDYSDIDAQVQAHKTDSGYYQDSDNNYHYYSKYEWEYNGKKHKTTFDSDTYPDIMMINVDRRTGKYKLPEAKRKTNKSIIWCWGISVIIGYIAACLICGYNPVFK